MVRLALDDTHATWHTQPMDNLYTFIRTSIDQGRTVLVYNTRTNGPTKHVRSMERVTMTAGEVCVDGVSVRGLTVALKP